MTMVNCMHWRAEGPKKSCKPNAFNCKYVTLRYVTLCCVRNGISIPLSCYVTEIST